MGNLDLILEDLLYYIFILLQVVTYTLTLQPNQHTFFLWYPEASCAVLS
jgi:hypothetical protein